MRRIPPTARNIKRQLRIAVLATCHNRRDSTVESFTSLLAQNLPEYASVSFYIVDDGSTDGTAEAVQCLIPSVTLIFGDGNLYWNRGMRKAMLRAYQDRCDLYLCINDDTIFYPNAIVSLLHIMMLVDGNSDELDPAIPAVVSGATKDPDTNEVSYGGVATPSSWHPLRFVRLAPNGTIQRCSAVNMNATLISRGVIDRIGILSHAFRHSRGDYDFSMRARLNGISVVLSPDYVGDCESNPTRDAKPIGKISPWRRFKTLLSVKYLPPWESSVYYRQHAGPLWPLLWLAPYMIFLIKEAARAFEIIGDGKR